MSVGPILDHPIPDDFLIQIGDITVSFGILENLMQSLAGLRISDNHRVTQIITSELAFKNLRALIVSLFLERGETNEHYLEVKELMNRAGKVEEKRN